MSVQQITVNVDGYLALNKYEVDEANAHIELVEDPSDEECGDTIIARWENPQPTMGVEYRFG